MILTKEIKDAHAQNVADLFGDQRENETPEQRIHRAFDEWFDPIYKSAVEHYVYEDPEVVAKRQAYEAEVAAKLAAETTIKPN